MTDALPSSLMASIVFCVRLRQTSGMVLCVVHVVSVRMIGITLAQKSFTSTCLSPVSCPAITVGQSTEKGGSNGRE